MVPAQRNRENAMTDARRAAFYEQLRASVGSTGASVPARDPVNQPMIRHWCDAMTDHNPLYTDPPAAEKSIHGGIVAPPPMLNAWTMTMSASVLSKSDAGGENLVEVGLRGRNRLGDHATGSIVLALPDGG